MGALASSQPVCSTDGASVHMTPDTFKIVMASLDYKTKTAYGTVWRRFSEFFKENIAPSTLPVSVVLLLNFLTSLFQLGYSTIASHVSAIAFIHKILGCSDPTSSFLVRQFLKGAKMLNGSACDVRLPITANILHQIVLALPKTVILLSHRLLLKAIFLLCFNAFLRMGEVCIKYGSSPERVIQREDLSFTYHSGAVIAIRIVIRNFKNNIKQLPMTLVIPLNSGSEMCCPVRALRSYFSEYKHLSGPLFQFQNGAAVPYSFVADKLHNIIGFLGLDYSRYKPHSFRIGAATSAYCQGLSEDDIKRLGRWESNAVRRYIRLATFSFPKNDSKSQLPS